MIRLFSFLNEKIIDIVKDYRTDAPFYAFYSLNFVANGTNEEHFW